MSWAQYFGILAAIYTTPHIGERNALWLALVTFLCCAGAYAYECWKNRDKD